MKRKIFSILFALVLVLSFSLIPVAPVMAAAPLSGYEVIFSPTMGFGDGGWGGWSVPAGKVVLGGGFYATAPVAASAPGTPFSVWPHYTYGAGEYGWVVRDAIDGASNTITIYAICADKPAGYGVIESAPLNYSDSGWAGWSVPAGKVVLGGGFVLSNPWATSAGAAAASAPGIPGSVWPHWTFGDGEYGWVVRGASDGISDPDSRVYAIYADEPAGYGVIESDPLNYSDSGWGGWSVPMGKFVLGGGFVLSTPSALPAGAAAVSVPGTPISVWPHYTYGAGEYGWVVRGASDGISSPGSRVYAICAYASTYMVSGGGWIHSPAGAYTASPELEGKASFGFVAKYKKGASVPDGQTKFMFQTADLNFHSNSYKSLVVTGSGYAKFKGSGTINGVGDYKFMLWAGDGEPDTFRIKIWEENGGEVVVYDNGFDGSGYENGQPISGGSIVIHKK